MLSARSHEAKPGVNGGKGTGGAAGRVHWSAAETLAPEGTQAPEGASQNDSALDAHVSVSEWGNAMPSGRLQAVRITAWDSGG